MNKKSVTWFWEKKKLAEPIVSVSAYDYTAAVLVDQLEYDFILVGDSLGMVALGYETTLPVTVEEMLHHAKAVVRGAKNTFVVVDMPFMSYQADVSDALRNAGRLIKESGAQAVKLEGGLDIVPIVKALVSAGIAVMGHVGLQPQSVHQLGGYRVQAKNALEAEALVEAGQALQDAGCFALVVECVPASAAARLSQALTIPVIGIGAGVECDGQILVWHDILGLLDRKPPKFVKPYASLAELQKEALRTYRDEVRARIYPSRDYSFA